MKNILILDEEEYSMSYQELRFELEPTPENESRERRRDEFVKASLPVSYTHLTLPTICSV